MFYDSAYVVKACLRHNYCLAWTKIKFSAGQMDGRNEKATDSVRVSDNNFIGDCQRIFDVVGKLLMTVSEISV